jgi:four helix bundle protein
VIGCEKDRVLGGKAGVGVKMGHERKEDSNNKIKLNSYKDLVAYQKGYQLTLDVYKATKLFPKEEVYGLVSQMRRSSASVPANIAEGYRRGHRKEYVQFLHIALGSCAELETFVSLSHNLGYLPVDSFQSIYTAQENVSRLLRRLISSLSTKRE